MEGVCMELNSEAIKVSNLSVKYHDLRRSIKNPFGKMISYTALDDVLFSIPKGQHTALLGKNGAGKSTLLRSIGGWIRPFEGEIYTNGRVLLLAGINPGFDNNLSGRENISRLGLVYGINKLDIGTFIQDVIDFADIGEAIDRPIKGYSTGMKGKIGFGIITGLNPEILLMDETLGVGDLEFRKKAERRLEIFMKRAGTIVISTHSLGLAKELCKIGIVLDKGKVAHEGPIEESIKIYREICS